MTPNLNDTQIFHHLPVVLHRVKSANDLFTQNVHSMNKFDIDENLYSRANEIPNFYGADGLLHFELCYPELSAECYIWDQSSDPMDTTISNVQGFNFKGPSSHVNHGAIPFIGLLSDSRYILITSLVAKEESQQ